MGFRVWGWVRRKVSNNKVKWLMEDAADIACRGHIPGLLLRNIKLSCYNEETLLLTPCPYSYCQ